MKKPPPILLAEDNENDIELTLKAFEESQIANRIDVVKNGQEALDYLNYNGNYVLRPKENPMVILLDLKMPKIDGLDVLKIIKADPNLKVIPVVMLTSSALETDLVKSYHLGVNGYVVKPINFVEFVGAIKKLSAFWVLLNKTVDYG
ncbi:MAG: response regulator [Bacteroidales bacterium]|nr:response regulator [Bacteroidales bacterium]MCF8459019.1 response regulator [Bacteroidales bacterium]